VNTNEQQQYLSTLPFPEPPARSAQVGPNDPPWGSAIAIVTWMASVLMIFIVPGIFLAPYLLSSGVHTQGQEALSRFATSDPTALLIQVAAVLPAHLVTLAIAWFVVTKGRTYPFLETLGWRSGNMRWWHHALILIGFLGLAAVVGSFMPEQENDLIRILRSSRLALYTVAFLAVFTAPFIEELIYRGVLYSALQRTTGVAFAVVIVTFLFALVHVPQYWGSPSTIVLLTLLSLILTLVRASTGNLLPCVILHTLFNAFQSALLIVNPELDAPTAVPPDPVSFFFHIFK
jgi:uncharacterized protein